MSPSPPSRASIRRSAHQSEPCDSARPPAARRYFGGNAAHRGQANIEMLAKCRLVMIEKWEGHCWQDCLAQGVGSPPCEASCDVESLIVDTLRRVKAINPSVAGVLYLNT